MECRVNCWGYWRGRRWIEFAKFGQTLSVRVDKPGIGQYLHSFGEVTKTGFLCSANEDWGGNLIHPGPSGECGLQEGRNVIIVIHSVCAKIEAWVLFHPALLSYSLVAFPEGSEFSSLPFFSALL